MRSAARSTELGEWLLSELQAPMPAHALMERATADLGPMCDRTVWRALARLLALGLVARIGSAPWTHYARAGSIYTRNGYDPSPMDSLQTKRARKKGWKRRQRTTEARA